jgi:hypothetical protein
MEEIYIGQLYTWHTIAYGALTWLQHKWFLLRFKIRWKIKNLSPSRRYYIRIPKNEKRPFVNIAIYPLDESCRVYDPTDILEQFIKKLKDDPPTLTGISGFSNGESFLDLRTNCSLVRSAN